MPTPKAIVGRFRTYVAIVAGTGMQRTRRNAATDLYMLFNAWCKDDAVFLPNKQATSTPQRPWIDVSGFN
ncbi:hypothetical protein FQN60_006972 [Etheostoma spectabile]|uniref:Uncharacterized protein n=1 Tax=Etheostoma spectabile TaxID=54343 RepID=A0A5J5CHD0_9PERO|nr:hypothetical protein FQN60_006972 [Etheostoma spectabile]